MKQDIAVVYMVAGISSRFGGKIKQFIKVGPDDETLMEYSMNQAIKAGFTKIIFIVGNLTEKPFKEKFGDDYKGIPIYYALQTYDSQERDRPWGTADALCTIKSIIDCPFVVCNGDDIYGENTYKLLLNHLKNSDEGGSLRKTSEKKDSEEATIGYKLCEVIPEVGKTNRGIFQINDCYVKDLKEVFNIEKSNLAATNCKIDDRCSMNFFALHPKVVDMVSVMLDDFKEQHKGDRRIEALLPEMLPILIKQGKIKMRIYPATDQWIGVTNPDDENIVREMLRGK